MVPEVFMNRTAICQQWSEWHNYLMNTINDNEFATYASTLAVQRHAHVASFTVNVPESVRVRVLHVWRRVIMAPAGRYLDDANRDDAIATALRDVKNVDFSGHLMNFPKRTQAYPIACGPCLTAPGGWAGWYG